MEYVTIVRANLKGGDPKTAQKAHDATVEKLSSMTRPMGATAHKAYLNPQKPMEFLAIDRWNNIEGLQKFLADPKVAEAFGALFEGKPDISVWAESDWASF
jgi:quinol monooxygenase YgiN